MKEYCIHYECVLCSLWMCTACVLYDCVLPVFFTNVYCVLYECVLPVLFVSVYWMCSLWMCTAFFMNVYWLSSLRMCTDGSSGRDSGISWRLKVFCDIVFTAEPVMIRNWCCSFIMCSYETVFWLLFVFCLVLWRWGWPVSDWNVFLLPLVYLWDCILQQNRLTRFSTVPHFLCPPIPDSDSTCATTLGYPDLTRVLRSICEHC